MHLMIMIIIRYLGLLHSLHAPGMAFHFSYPFIHPHERMKISISDHFGANRNPAQHLWITVVRIRYHHSQVHIQIYVYSFDTQPVWTSCQKYFNRQISGSDHLAIQWMNSTFLLLCSKCTLSPVSREHSVTQNTVAPPQREGQDTSFLH